MGSLLGSRIDAVAFLIDRGPVKSLLASTVTKRFPSPMARLKSGRKLPRGSPLSLLLGGPSVRMRC